MRQCGLICNYQPLCQRVKGLLPLMPVTGRATQVLTPLKGPPMPTKPPRAVLLKKWRVTTVCSFLGQTCHIIWLDRGTEVQVTGACVINVRCPVPGDSSSELRSLEPFAGQRQEQLSNMFSKHAFSVKRKAEGEAAALERRRKQDKQQRSHEDTPEREGLDAVFA